MKSKLFLAIALAATSMAFAQKKEVKAIEKAIKSGSYTEAKTLLGAAEALTANMDEKTKEKFMLLKAQAYLGVDNQNQEDLEKAAMAYSDLKDTKYSNEAEAGLANVTNAYINGAVADQNGQDYASAATKLEKAYNLSKKDTVYLYFAASNAINGKDYDTALGYYEQLKDLGFKGREVSYVATNVETSEVENFPSKQERDLQVLAKTHVKPEEQLGDSKSAEIAKNIALIYISKDENEKALAAMADARKENPDDILLLRSEADIYLKMKKMDKYQEVIAKVLEKDPNNPELLYNLGVSTDQQGNKEKAKEYYMKAVELDPTYAAAYNNIAVLILSDERAIVDEMNSLGTSKADYDKYDALKVKRQDVYKNAVPYLEKALAAKPDYLDVARSLYGIYEQLGETSKADAMKANIEKLEGGN
ncbi:tetratricopeptide repeat protein [uncultured Dokdonia sp.]|uniref:tetratricopeptide repeat protein n=1 Tax=uncultured Dokdonia sp. TaxID=575653 RepID=UPI0030ED1A43|tara:strand:+ start:68184 stop:69440 length:1257 start_codon:yes stop_codon:yes gene_type:complete